MRKAIAQGTTTFLDQRAIEALLGFELEGAQAGGRLVEVAPLALELTDALSDPLEPAPVLRRSGRVGLQVLADGLDRKSEPPQSLDEDEACPVLIIEDAGARPTRAGAISPLSS
jgi:hypothetical protein